MFSIPRHILATILERIYCHWLEIRIPGVTELMSSFCKSFICRSLNIFVESIDIFVLFYSIFCICLLNVIEILLKWNENFPNSFFSSSSSPLFSLWLLCAYYENWWWKWCENHHPFPECRMSFSDTCCRTSYWWWKGVWNVLSSVLLL